MVETFKEYISDVFVIQAWRSLWYFEDKYISPNDSIKSACISLLIGLPIYALLYIFNHRANTLISSTVDKKNSNKKLTTNPTKQDKVKQTCATKYILNMTFIFSFISTVNVWRGFWMLQFDLCYPLIFESSVILNQMILHFSYMTISLVVLW